MERPFLFDIQVTINQKNIPTEPNIISCILPTLGIVYDLYGISSCTPALPPALKRNVFARNIWGGKFPFFVQLFQNLHGRVITFLLDFFEFAELHSAVLSWP